MILKTSHSTWPKLTVNQSEIVFSRDKKVATAYHVGHQRRRIKF